MDPNLTQPITLNATLNATLIQPLQPLWKDWLPAFVSIIVVILGGFITYFVMIAIEERKRHYELKRQAYFEFIDLTTKATYIMQGFKENIEEARKKNDDSSISKAIESTSNFVQEQAPQNNALRIKIRISGSSKVKRIIDDWGYKAISEADIAIFDPEKGLTKEVIDAMKEDLLKPWWHFWK